MYQSFQTMPDHARVWVYQANRAFTATELQTINQLLTDFANTWDSHGKGILASFSIEHNQFIIISADETVTAASGCSIDKSVGAIREIEKQTGVTLLDRSQVAYLHNDQVQTVSLAGLKQKIAEGAVQPDTVLFDNTCVSLGVWRNSWRNAAKNTWAKRFFDTVSV
ncbi:hypothetical protein SAMN05421780_10770 [Flexibacter flexilis DSM 6793]|uniref:ABC transporter ATPase n=1 Tax=Flexibacter flexilis DSM 6793 TaxID=927664 RepID=A0A1I1KNV2_9BACT|nr:hypothetical protein [Flexibacter flexilis]SFC60358.1 hypothetical protein SAMN05421780_10770 [Flexibacter flexilis DSM 6793]